MKRQQILEVFGILADTNANKSTKHTQKIHLETHQPKNLYPQLAGFERNLYTFILSSNFFNHLC